MAITLSPSIRRVFAVCAVALLAAGCGGSKRPPRQAGAAVVPVATAAYGTVMPTSSLSGTVAPLQNVGITSTLSEPTDAIYVQEGDHVRAGEVLARLDIADLQAEYDSDIATAKSDEANANKTYDQAGLTIVQNSNTVNQAKAAVLQAQQTLSTDRLNLQRDAQLLKSGYIAQQTYDAQLTTVRNDEQAVRSAQVNVSNDVQQVQANGTTSTGLQGATVATARAQAAAAFAAANQVKVQIDKATIVSPINGVVVNRNLNLGEFPGTRQIFTIQEVDKVYAVLSGAGSQIVGIRNGAPVTITAETLPGKTLHGTVVGVLNAVQPGTTNFVVKAVVSNGSDLLRPGMVVSGVASLPTTSGIRIPATAFLDTTDSTVQTVRNGIVATVPVTMLAEDDRNAIVTGLNPGETVVTNGALGLADGQKVIPQSSQRQVAEH